MEKNTKTEQANILLKQELLKEKRKNKKLSQQLAESKNKAGALKQELKKKDVRKMELSKEQEQLLSNLSKDMGIPNLLSD